MAPSSQKGCQNRKGRHSREIRTSPLRPLFATFLEPFLAPKRGVKTRERARGRKGRKTLRKNATQKRPPGRRGGPKATISPRVFGPFRTGPPKGPNGPKRPPFASVKYGKKKKNANSQKRQKMDLPKKGPFSLANSRGPGLKRAQKEHQK